MQKISFLPVKIFIFFIGFMLVTVQFTHAQSEYLPYSYQFNQKFNSSVYSISNGLHTSLKPFIIDSALRPRYNEIMSVGVDTGRKSWVPRKLFNEHLFDIKTKEYTFFADYLTNFQFGQDVTDKLKTNINTRGYQIGGTVGDKFYFYTSGYENQGKFATYLDQYITKIDFVPGQGYDRNASFGASGGRSKDWSYATAILSYSPSKKLNFTLGYDKTFIGDGYRSLLLSDFSANYPLFRITANLGHVQYMLMWAYLEDIGLPKFDSQGSNRRKYAAFHYLDWNISKRVSLGFFNALIAGEADDYGNYHGFDANYVNPLFFSSSLGPSGLQPDKVLVGFTGKYKIFDKTAIYGQLLIDRFKSSNFFNSTNADNTNGMQIGLRGADLFGAKNLNYLFEYNTVKPYTYTSGQGITAYTQYSEPLGHPLGANFKEYLGILNYSIGRLDIMGQVNYAQYGLDPQGANFGRNISLPYSPSTATTTTVGQGISTQLYFGEGTISLLINPKYNLHLEASALFRYEKNSIGSYNTQVISFGINSSFRNLYKDF